MKIFFSPVLLYWGPCILISNILSGYAIFRTRSASESDVESLGVSNLRINTESRTESDICPSDLTDLDWSRPKPDLSIPEFHPPETSTSGFYGDENSAEILDYTESDPEELSDAYKEKYFYRQNKNYKQPSHSSAEYEDLSPGKKLYMRLRGGSTR